MKLETFLFGGEEYERLARVLVTSASQFSPSTSINVRRVNDTPDHIKQVAASRKYPFNYAENTWKTILHKDLIDRTDDGEVVCLLDSDLLVLGDLSEAKDFTADLTITCWPINRPNTGVYFVKVSDTMRLWMRNWELQTLYFLTNPKAHSKYRWLYGGINQAALGWLMERRGSQGIPDIEIRSLPGNVWNCAPEAITRFSSETKIVHIMSCLRKLCFGEWDLSQVEVEERPLFEQVIALWRKFDHGAQFRPDASRNTSDSGRRAVCA